MIQLCLSNVKDLEAMKKILGSVAVSNNLTLYDRSLETQAELEAIAETQKDFLVARPTINIGTLENGKGFSVGNFAEAPLQIVVGFSKGSDPTTAQTLAIATTRALAEKWKVYEVHNPKLTGAFPLKQCNLQST